VRPGYRDEIESKTVSPTCCLIDKENSPSMKA
jgi:hypothetical protein